MDLRQGAQGPHAIQRLSATTYIIIIIIMYVLRVYTM